MSLNEKEILDRLFSASEEKNIPERTVVIKRIGLSFTLRALKEDIVEQLEQEYTKINKVRGKEERELDRNRYFRALIAKATVAIGGDPNIRWDHPSLLEKYKASSDEQVIKRVLLSGEITQLADIVLDLSGYYDAAQEEDEIKNLSPKED